MANPLQQAMQRQFVDDALSNKLKPLKPALSHVGLYMGLMVYTAVGALVITLKSIKDYNYHCYYLRLFVGLIHVYDEKGFTKGQQEACRPRFLIFSFFSINFIFESRLNL